jgi:uncharacterized protein YqcC (DUF446 family)
MQADSVKQKVEELAAALKAQGLWKKEEPAWVNEYKENTDIPEVNFFEWLQFVYLPNRMLNPSGFVLPKENFITVQAKKFASDKLMDKKIVQLLVELDAL